jgi:enterobacterial common antigen flippase
VRELWQDIAITSGAKVYSLLAGLLVLVLTARLLGPDGRGVIAAVMTWTALFGTLGSLSLGQVAVHRAAGQRDARWLGPVLGSLLTIAVVVTACGWAIAALGYALTSGRLFGNLPWTALVIGFAALPFVVWEQYGSFLLTATGRLGTFNRALVIGRTASIVAVLVLVWWLAWGVEGALVAALVGQGIIALAGVTRWLAAADSAIVARWTVTKELIADGLKLHVNAVGTFCFTGLTILLIQYFRGSEETGLFQLALQLVGVLVIIPQSASLALYRAVSASGPDGAWPANKNLLFFMTLVMMAAAALAAAAAPLLIPLVAGQRFAASVGLFRLLLLTVIGQTVSAVMAPQWIGRGLFLQASVVTITIGVLNVVASWVLVPEYGLYGAAWVAVGIHALIVLVNVAMAIRIDYRLKNAPMIGLEHVG